MTTEAEGVSEWGSTEVEAIGVHHLRPCGDEVFDELRPGIRAPIHLGGGAELRVRPEHEIDTRPRPFELPRLAIAPLELFLVVRLRLPLGVHVEQILEKIVRERLR